MPQDQELDMDAISERIKSDPLLQPVLVSLAEACRDYPGSVLGWHILPTATAGRVEMNFSLLGVMSEDRAQLADAFLQMLSDTPSDTPDKLPLLLRGLGH